MNRQRSQSVQVITKPKPSQTPLFQGDFALQILEKEIQLEDSPSLEHVQELVQLYSRAIEFYEHQKDPKRVGIQERMKALLKRPSVVSLLESTGKNNSKIKKETSDERKVLKKLHFFIERNEKNIKNVTRNAINDLFAQESFLRRRLNQRRFRSSSVSCSTEDSSFSEDFKPYELSFLTGISIQLQIELEELMEKSYADQTARTNEVLFKYQRINNEVALTTEQQFGASRALQVELDSINHEFQEMRKELIQSIKNQSLSSNKAEII